MRSSVIESARDRIVSNGWLLEIAIPVVNLYRRTLAEYGSSTTTLTASGLTNEYYTQTFEEVRHFHPVFAEREELSDLLSELQDTDIFYDIGAHIGIYTSFASNVVNKGNVIAFEPHPMNVERLQENLDLNNATANIQPVALSDESGEVKISIDSESPGAMAHLSSEKRPDSVGVDMVVGDEYLTNENIPTPDVIKIDVEGAELKVLRGLEGSLDECRLIYCEVSDQLRDYGASETDLVEFLHEHGFEIEYFAERDAIHGDFKAVRV